MPRPDYTDHHEAPSPCPRCGEALTAQRHDDGGSLYTWLWICHAEGCHGEWVSGEPPLLPVCVLCKEGYPGDETAVRTWDDGHGPKTGRVCSECWADCEPCVELAKC